MMKINLKFILVLKYLSHFIMVYAIMTMSLFIFVGFINFNIFKSTEYFTNVNYITFLNNNVNLFIIFSAYFTLAINANVVTINLPDTIHNKIRDFFLKYDLEKRSMINDIMYYSFIVIAFSVIPIQSYFTKDILYNNPIHIFLIMIFSVSIILMPIIMNDYDSSLLYLNRYLATKDINALKKSFRYINKIYEKLINEKIIYQILQYISANDIIGKTEHNKYLQDLHSSLIKRESVLLYDSFFNLFKLSTHKKDIHIIDILTDVKLPYKTRIKDFIAMNWKYLLPPSIILGWLLNKM